jgi:dTDP-4-dehydrorhamnose 3,5-epimerase
MNYPRKIKTKKYLDNRGYFKEIIKLKDFKKNFPFDCFSKSKKNVFRGLHIQLRRQQAKLITVVRGEIIDFAINLKKNSKNFGKVYKFKINEDSDYSIYIPEGYAHGFLCLSDYCNLYYKCSNYRDEKSELSINYKCLRLLNKKKLILSKKDREALSLQEIKKIL